MKLVIVVLIVLLASCTVIREGRYKVTIDDSDVLTPANVFYVAIYYFEYSGVLCYAESIGDKYICYQKAINESISVEPVSE